MKLSNCSIYLFVILLVNLFQSGRCDQCSSDDGKIHQDLHNATFEILLSRLPPLCADLFFNKDNIRSKYISSKGLSGRALPAGTFTTKALAVDFLYGVLCPVGFQSVELVRLICDQKSFITQSEFIYTLTDGRRITSSATMAFDKDYKLCAYDSQIRNNGLTLDTQSVESHQAAINVICTLADNYCNDKSKQYDNIKACKQYLTTEVPFGSFDRADQSNVVCRLMHSMLIPINPTRYCPRVGPTGGDVCTNKTIDCYYNQPDCLACAHKYK